MHSKIQKIFLDIFESNSESDVEIHVAKTRAIVSWAPLGGDENMFGVVENQQASPVAALIEKVTNSIDALLMKHCLEAGLDPRGSDAPQTMPEAIGTFFKDTHKNWYLTPVRKEQAQEIQIIASGSKKNPSLLIYDNGEGQHPENFEKTFLSLLRGNKNDIPFVQGKYNMGGTGAIVFCGKQRYQLVGSKRYDGSGEFGFTLVRKHPMSDEDRATKKNTWYEYMLIDGKIPSFPIDELDLGLHCRKFTTGTIVKLFDYDLYAKIPRGALPQEGRRAINQFLFQPALPIYLVDSKERYPNNKVLDIDCYGLKHRLESDNKYIAEHFTEEYTDHEIGTIKATCYVFNPKVDKWTVKETKKNIQDQFFHDNMVVLFSLNGQVHGSFTSEFITRALKMPLLKNHLLIHVDCTELKYDFRQELFMASRDRLKGGDESSTLRKKLAQVLIKGRLTETYKARKNAISVEGGDAKDLLRAFSKNLPFNKDLMKLLNSTFKLEQKDDSKKKPDQKKKLKVKPEKEPFDPNRYPTFFDMKTGNGKKLLTLPERNEKTIQFATDVENQYFERSDDPGELKISILQHKTNETEGGKGPGKVDRPGELFDVRKSSPKDGTIRVSLGATADLKVGDEVEIEATLGGPENYECRFWVKIVEPSKEPKDTHREKDDDEPQMGLPDYVLVYKEAPEDQEDVATWATLDKGGIEMDYPDVMHPLIDGDQQLEKVYINMDSTTLRNYISKQGAIGIDQKELAEKKYISSIYFHTIFLYSITKNQGYALKKGDEETDLSEYLEDVFSGYYTDFLLNFGTEQLMASLED